MYDSYMQCILVISYGLLTIIYATTLTLLIKAMNRLIVSDLEDERRSVTIQFSLMLVSFSSHFVYFTFGIIFYS